jgi:glycosyltransferase involved in cell wall biosynthesis
VDTAFFSPESATTKTVDLVFVGSMDWMPNIDAMKYFVADILPLIRRRRPNCSVAIVGREPAPEVLRLAEQDPQIQVTGTVPDVRPWLWRSKLSIVPLRIGGGTRLKIFESMAAKVPVVSTSVGAEGLDVSSPCEIRIADTAEDFANQCIQLLEDDSGRACLAEEGWRLTRTKFSWGEVVKLFEKHLQG